MLDQLWTHKGLPAESVFLNFRKLLDNILTPYMVMDTELIIIYANDAYLQTVERSLNDIVGRYIFDSFPDSDERVAEVRATFLETLDGQPTKLERQFFEFEHADGTSSTKCWQCVQTPYYGPDGDVIYIIQHAEDVTAAVALEQKNDMVARELDHRVKNMFAVVQSVAALSSQRAETADDFREDFIARLAAMSRTYDALSSADWNGLQLSEIFRAELDQYGGAPSTRIGLSGPDIRFGPRASQDASMVFHELATNAAKYGCFSTATGRLDISWHIDRAANKLEIEWAESGMSGITEPVELGFGSQLTNFMPTVSVERIYRPEGLVVRASMDLPAVRQPKTFDMDAQRA